MGLLLFINKTKELRTIELIATTLTSLALFLSPHSAVVKVKHHKHHHKAHIALVEHKYISNNVTCYHEGSQTSAGPAPYVGEVAVLPGYLPLGTRILLDHPVFGKREFVVLDHIGWGSELDIYGPSEEACNQFGRQSIGFWRIGNIASRR